MQPAHRFTRQRQAGLTRVAGRKRRTVDPPGHGDHIRSPGEKLSALHPGFGRSSVVSQAFESPASTSLRLVLLPPLAQLCWGRTRNDIRCIQEDPKEPLHHVVDPNRTHVNGPFPVGLQAPCEAPIVLQGIQQRFDGLLAQFEKLHGHRLSGAILRARIGALPDRYVFEPVDQFGNRDTGWRGLEWVMDLDSTGFDRDG